MKIIEGSPLSIEFKCHNCFGRYAVEREDVSNPDGVEYGQYYSAIICPVCGGKDYVDWSHFPALWTQEAKEASERVGP